MASVSASVVDTGIRTLDVAHAISAIASSTSTVIGLIPAIARQAQDR